MRAQFADLFTVTFLIVFMVFIIGPNTLKYFTQPQGNYFEYMVINAFKAYLEMPKPVAKAEFMDYVEKFPFVDYIDRNLWDYVIGIVNLLKFGIFIFITGFTLTHIWQWCSVLGITAKR